MRYHKVILSFFAIILVIVPGKMVGQEAGLSQKFIYLNEESIWRSAPGPNDTSLPRNVKVKKFRVGEYGIVKDVGFFGQNLREAMTSNPDAIAELNKYTRRQTGFVMSFAVIGAGALVAIVTQEDTGKRTYNPLKEETTTKKRLTGAGKVGFAVAGVAAITAFVFNFGSDKHITRAVDIYNRGIKEQKKIQGSRIQITPSHHALGINISISF